MFEGQSTVALDAKGRISIPAQLREGLSCEPEQALHVTFDELEGCLAAYPVTRWQKIKAGLGASTIFNRTKKRFIRNFFSRGAKCELNKAGRMLIPQELRAMAELKRDVVVVGMINYIEIWDAEKFEPACQMSPEEMEDFLKDLEKELEEDGS